MLIRSVHILSASLIGSDRQDVDYRAIFLYFFAVLLFCDVWKVKQVIGLDW